MAEMSTAASMRLEATASDSEMKVASHEQFQPQGQEMQEVEHQDSQDQDLNFNDEEIPRSLAKHVCSALFRCFSELCRDIFENFSFVFIFALMVKPRSSSRGRFHASGSGRAARRSSQCGAG